jgi:thioredoxin-related protein
MLTQRVLCLCSWRRDLAFPGRAVVAVILLGCISRAGASAQEVAWRHDYAAARREAKETQRPIVMDFGTKSCIWCKKLDVTTFRDLAVVRQLNEQFIPVKIDAEQEAALAKALRIQTFPTLVFATPEGRILGRHEGYVEAERFRQQLGRALNESAPIARVVAPPAAGPGPTTSSQAGEILSMAQRDLRQRQFLSCLERCTLLTATYPGSPEAREAQQLAFTVKHDPAIAAQLCQQLSEYLGELYLAQAETALQANDPQRAMSHLDQVLQVSPGTPLAQQAQERRERLQNARLDRRQAVDGSSSQGQ